MDRAYSTQTSVAARGLTTPLATLLRQLQDLGAPSQRPQGARARSRARIQALHWLEELETTECLDELWPAFEAWLREHPENRHQYVLAERAQLVIEDLRRACPEEGSEAAKQLLQLRPFAAAPKYSRPARAKWLVLTAALAVVGTVVVYWARHQFG